MSILFTITGANKALVFVKPVLENIQVLLQDMIALHHSPTPEFEKQMEKRLKRIQACFEELKLVGCICRDPERGIVDFPSFYKNTPIFLCWHLGEEAVEHWHYLNESSELRRPMDEEFIAEQQATSPSAIA